VVQRCDGGVAEWSIAPVLKTGVSKGTVSKANNGGGGLGRGRETGVSRVGNQRAKRALRTEDSQEGASATTSHPLRISVYRGTVRQGSQTARVLGFPTVNVAAKPEESGIYAGRVRANETEFPAAVYTDRERGLVEAHILGADLDLYGIEIEITLVHKIRAAKHFADDSALKRAIAQDVADVRDYFKNR
jgi:FAD synthase